MATGSTFLVLANKVIRHFNEVQLTSTNFSAATGFQDFVKDSILDAVRIIEQSEQEWPWRWNAASQTLTGTTQDYSFPTTTLDTTDKIDWDSFVLKRDDTLDPTVTEKRIQYISWDQYLHDYAARDANISTGDASIREPKFVTWRQEEDKYRLTPTPDRAYTIGFEWWGFRADMSAHGDTTRIPQRFDHVIDRYAKSFCYDWRGDESRAAKLFNAGDSGVSDMKISLVNREQTLRSGRIRNRTG